jgi:hypothetical protein
MGLNIPTHHHSRTPAPGLGKYECRSVARQDVAWACVVSRRMSILWSREGFLLCRLLASWLACVSRGLLILLLQEKLHFLLCRSRAFWCAHVDHRRRLTTTATATATATASDILVVARVFRKRLSR